MINFEKIKLGKGLTPNQKRIREVYLKHKLNLEGEEIKGKDYLRGHKVRLINVGMYVECSRSVEKVYLVFDNKSDKNISLEFDKSTDWNFYSSGFRYPKCSDIVYIVLGKKNIKGYLKGKCGEFDGIWSFYDNKGVYSTIRPIINHRKQIEKDILFRKVKLVKKKFDKKMFYAHGSTKEDAERDLKYKIRNYISEKKKERRKNAYKEFFDNLKYNSVINVKRYRYFTGACEFGCKEFAKRENLDINSRLKVSDLLKYLQPTDYGYDRIVRALGIETRC